MFGLSPLNTVLVIWGVVTGILAILLIYRSTISMKEDDQLFLDSAQTNLEEEQREVRMRLQRLTPYTAVLSVTSGVLLIASAGLWVYEQFTKAGF
jgi:hypothetical protein